MVREIRNIKYTYYDRRDGSGPYQGTHSGYTPSQTSFTSIEDLLQKTNPDYCNFHVISYDEV